MRATRGNIQAGAVLIVGAIFFVGCSSQLGVLDEHEQLWAKSHPANYAYTYKSGGELPNLEFRVTVRDGVVTDTTAISAPPGTSPRGEPIENLFDDARAQLASDCDVSVAYDEERGFPKSISADCGSEGYAWGVTDFAGIQ